MRLLDRIIVLGVLLWVGGQLLERVGEEVVGPPPAVEARAEALPRGAPDADGLPELVRGRVGELPVEHPRRGGYRSGTAWQAGDGIWLSNRHVVEHCDLFRLGPTERPRVSRLWRHPDSDLAAFESAVAPRALALAGAPPAAGAAGWAVGFPKGQAGVVRVTLIGAGRMRLTGAVRSDRPFRYLLWRIERLPGHVADAGELGGISGGAVLDRNGRAVGVAFSSVPRRALLGTIPFADTRRAVEATGARPVRAALAEAGPADIPAHAAALLREGAVSRVLCRS